MKTNDEAMVKQILEACKEKGVDAKEGTVREIFQICKALGMEVGAPLSDADMDEVVAAGGYNKRRDITDS